MTSTTRTTRRGALAAAVAAALCAAPALTFAQAPDQAQPPAGGQPPMGASGAPGAMRGPGGPGMGGPRGMSMLMEGITLTDAQRTRVDSINTAFRQQMRAARELAAVPGQGGGPGANGAPLDSAGFAARRAQMRQQMQAHNAALRSVLTPDQQKTFDANLQRMEQMRQQRMQQGGGMGPGGPARR